MSLFRRKPPPPPFGCADLERYGRHKIRGVDSTDWAFAADLEQTSYRWSVEDRAGYVAAVLRCAESGGWTAFGAARLVADTLGVTPGDPAVDGTFRPAMEFLRSRGIPKTHLTGYESTWWASNSGGVPWLVGRPAPDPATAPISPLADGELRRVANMGPSGNDNDILVVRSETGFKAVIQGRYSDEDPRLVRNDWLAAPTLFDLYVRLGEALVTPKPWMHPELVPYIPLPPPNFG